MTTNPFSPAFPLDCDVHPNRDTEHLGMTKREHFAAMAMQGLLAYSDLDFKYYIYAGSAVEMADALIAALNEVKP